MTTSFIIAQILGLVAVACFIISFQIKSNRKLFIFQGAGCLAFFLEFLFLGAISGSISQIVALLRNMMLTKYNSWAWVRWKGWIVIIAIIMAIITYFTWNGLISIIPFIALMGGTIGMFTNNAGKIRLANLFVVSPAWLVYDVIVKAYTGMLNEIFLITAILVSIKLYGWKEMADPDSKFQKD